MSRWFRHYAGLCRDEKLVRAAMKSGQPVERVVWVWAAILESAAEIDDAGRFELDSAEVAYFLRADEADIDSVVSALEAGGRVSGDHVVNWGARQFQSDSSAERQRRHRDRQKAQGDAQRGDGDKDVERHADDGVKGGDGDVTATDRHGDGHVTSPSRRGDAPETETETETETEKKETPSLRSGSKKAGAPELASAGEPPTPEAVAPPEPVPKPPRKRPATAIPPDFEPDLREALGLGLGLDLAIGESAKFRDYAIAKDWRNVDWPAAWRNWCRKAKNDENASVSGHRTGRAEPPHTTIFRALAGAAEARARRDERPPDPDGGVFADSGGGAEDQVGAGADRGPVFAHG